MSKLFVFRCRCGWIAAALKKDLLAFVMRLHSQHCKEMEKWGDTFE